MTRTTYYLDLAYTTKGQQFPGDADIDHKIGEIITRHGGKWISSGSGFGYRDIQGYFGRNKPDTKIVDEVLEVLKAPAEPEYVSLQSRRGRDSANVKCWNRQKQPA